MHRWRVGALVVVAAWLLASSARGAVSPLPRPELRLERRGAETLVWLEADGPAGGTTRRLLRITTSEVTPGATGGEPTGRAAFVTWTEAGERWSSYSRDGGASWSQPRPLATDLLLRDGATPPGRSVPAPAWGLALPAEGRLYLVQLRTIGLPEWRDALRGLGVELFQPFPYHAYVARIDPVLVPRVASLDFVERVVPYHPAYRLEAALREWLASTPGDSTERERRVRVIALERSEPGKARIEQAARTLGARLVVPHPAGRVLEVEVTREALRQLAAHDDVLWIDGWSAPENDMNLVRIDSGTAWVEDNFGYCGQGVRGEVLDEGIEATHQDFDGVMLHGTNTAASHGTKVYGILFGNGNHDGDGLALATGQLPCASQGISADYEFLGDRFAHTQELKGAPYFASFQNNSWGGGLTTAYNSTSFEMDDIIWQLDIAITQSQSNSGSQLSRPEAWAKNVISVGGIHHFNTLVTTDDSWSSGPLVASIGPAEDGRTKPDLAYWNDFIFTTTVPNSYTDFAGTSASTPAVAGVLGIILEMWSQNVWGTNPQGQTVYERQPHFSTLKALLINSAQQYPFSGSLADLGRYKQGWGRPSAKRAKERAARSFVIDETVPLEIGEWASIDLDVAPGESELKVTMTYPDPPGTTSATLHRINDLDLQLTSPTGVVYHGNSGLRGGPWSTPGGTPEGMDTVENVFVQNPTPGLWRARVEAVEVEQDAHMGPTLDTDVAFGLVATGATGHLCSSVVVDFSANPPAPTVGQPVQFTSTVFGGAPGQLTYRWDFDEDGVVDSTLLHPIQTYHSPYSGNVRLEVVDSAGCVEAVDHPIVVNGPNVVFSNYLNLTEINGNGNGQLDPGETWDVDVRLSNVGGQTAFGISARLATVAGNPGGVVLTQDTASFGDVPAGNTAVGQQHYRVRIGQGFPCGAPLSLAVLDIASTSPANVYPGTVQLLASTASSCQRLILPGPGDVTHLDANLGLTGDLELSWTPDCAQGTAYSLYRGSLTAGYTSAAPVLCDLAATSAVLPAGNDPEEFFFVAPSDDLFDGSYGRSSSGAERPPLAVACHPQDVFPACAP